MSSSARIGGGSKARMAILAYLGQGAVFLFEAEDDIRDVAVTGVQTCALPISLIPPRGGAGPLEAARWNQRAAPGKCASSVRGSSGRRQDCGISVPWKKPARMVTGTNSGTRTDGGTVKMRPNGAGVSRVLASIVTVPERGSRRFIVRDDIGQTIRL